VFLDVDFTLPNTLCNWSSSRNCLDTGIITEWVLEKNQQYSDCSRILSFLFFLLFVCSLIFGIKRWTQLFFNFFLFCFFLQFLFDAVWELFSQIWELFRYGKYLGRYGNCSDMGIIIQAVTGNIQADKFQNYVFFFYFLFVP